MLNCRRVQDENRACGTWPDCGYQSTERHNHLSKQFGESRVFTVVSNKASDIPNSFVYSGIAQVCQTAPGQWPSCKLPTSTWWTSLNKVQSASLRSVFSIEFLFLSPTEDMNLRFLICKNMYEIMFNENKVNQITWSFFLFNLGNTQENWKAEILFNITCWDTQG